MSEAKSKTRVERTFYPSGQQDTEVNYVDDQICGITRHWHENGVLKKEVPMNNSQVDGTIRQWDSMGNLLGECEIQKGTGVFRTWHDNGQLKGELPMKDGLPRGRQRSWDESGELLIEAFYVAGRRVSRKKYQEACATDLTLPRYDVDDGQVPWSERHVEPAVEHHLISAEEYEDARDALKWLRGSSEQAPRTLGELASAEDSIELVQEFLANGAERVLAVHVDTDDDGSENTGDLLIELPSDSRARKKALEFCNEQNRLCGYSPIKDTDQRFVQVALD